MTYVLAILAAIAGGALGALAGVAIGGLLASSFGISNFEGAAAYFSVLTVGPVGLLAGLVLGPVLLLRYRGIRGGRAVAGRTALAVAGAVAISAAAGAIYYNQADDILNPNAAPVRLAFEIKLAPGAEPSARQDRGIELRTNRNIMPPNKVQMSRDGERIVLAGDVDLYFRTSNRLLAIRLANNNDVTFNLPLAGRPEHGTGFSPWRRGNNIPEQRKDLSKPPPDAAAYEVRYRVIWPGRD